jgi:hypothetical protein
MKNWMFWLAVGLLSIVAIALIVDPGLALLIVFGIAPFVVVNWILRERRINQIKQAVNEYILARKRGH